MTILERPVWAFSEDILPCRCFSPGHAMEDDLWQCKQGPKWLVVDEYPTLEAHHEMAVCDGACSNTLHTTSNLQLAYAEFNSMSWGELDQLWEEEKLSQLSSRDRATLKAQKAAQQAQDAAAEELEALSRKLASKARDHEIKAGYKCNKGKKEMTPCKYLYSCEGDRKTGGARATTLCISSECWSHAYTDPATGKRVEKHACWFLHPEEPGWCKEWETDRRFKPAGFVAPAVNNRFAHLGEPRQQQQQQRRQPQQPQQQRRERVQKQQQSQPQPQPKKNTNAFSYLDDSD
jgi:hypothetical protein